VSIPSANKAREYKGFRASEELRIGKHTVGCFPPKRKVVGSDPARNGSAAGDFVEKTGPGGIFYFRDDLSNGH
jgi:hypothetical protein